jgi:hypothetical protein
MSEDMQVFLKGIFAPDMGACYGYAMAVSLTCSLMLHNWWLMPFILSSFAIAFVGLFFCLVLGKNNH